MLPQTLPQSKESACCVFHDVVLIMKIDTALIKLDRENSDFLTYGNHSISPFNATFGDLSAPDRNLQPCLG